MKHKQKDLALKKLSHSRPGKESPIVEKWISRSLAPRSNRESDMVSSSWHLHNCRCMHIQTN
ncbi:unnamed protein product [Clavelina lepadiformis]|uniref:Uncharacterized protein n=1 Tax=Clavelina lepadiformis TaxID=159417 RepID=A0ABP0FCX9_CLALP